jgi:hypothetical protein
LVRFHTLAICSGRRALQFYFVAQNRENGRYCSVCNSRRGYDAANREETRNSLPPSAGPRGGRNHARDSRYGPILARSAISYRKADSLAVGRKAGRKHRSICSEQLPFLPSYGTRHVKNRAFPNARCWPSSDQVASRPVRLPTRSGGPPMIGKVQNSSLLDPFWTGDTSKLAVIGREV